MAPESDPLTEPRKVVEDTNANAKFFQFDQHQAKLSTEILAGITTFVTMAYILVVNPDILSNAIFLQQPKDF
ncbi:hypothetical protein LYNGBM3L_49040 [Moorena producens 3L]|uniref:Uncharacterized protein n=1 Tax=Moorena producens 3L TaxID=489825 RepID=F4XXS9_9CYAN|nr:hypothetical protein LYNGBM3L_49040 [Moorena producens 3L]OLT68854.1 hypothetical protein BI334_31010 [Moorena producens 3L]